MVDFAKLHVKAALEKVSSGEVPPEYYGQESRLRTRTDKDSIINAYPLTNIV